MSLKLRIFFLTGSLLFLASCNGLYNIFHDRPENTGKYLEQFREAAGERGIEINYPNRLQIRLVDYMSGTRVGYCYNDIPMKIDLDRNFWTTADTTQQKILFFHELGHCMLNRKHDNEVLPNGEWKSLMRGSPIPENRDYVINFSGFRSDYYLNELFDAETQEPEWVNISKDLNNDLELALDEDFSNNDRDWTTINEPGRYLAVSDNTYIIRNEMDSSSVNSISRIILDTDNDFQIRADFTLRMDSLDSAGGIFFGTSERFEYFLIDQEYGMRFGTTSGFRPYTNIPLPDSVLPGDLSLTIEKTGNRQYYYLDEQLVYVNQAAAMKTDSLFVGFNLASHSEMVVRGLKIYN